MRTEWNQFSPRLKVEFSRVRKENFRTAVVTAFLNHPDEPFVPTDQELADLCKIPIRSAKRYLSYWKEKGIFHLTSSRYKHPVFGWCVRRTLTVDPAAIEIARAHIERYGKVL
jgi:hypothetical protein